LEGILPLSLDKIASGCWRNFAVLKKSLMLLISLSVVCVSPAFAKGKARAFSFFDDGGKHNQAECDPEKKAPRKMKSQKRLMKFSGYLGSELLEKADENPDGVEAWKHYFNSSGSCLSALKAQTKL
jgi:hypothetical protein